MKKFLTKLFTLTFFSFFMLTLPAVHANEPFELKGSMHNKKDVLLTWNSDNPSTEYHIYRSTSEDDTFKQIATVTSEDSNLSYIDSGLSLGTTYLYKIEKINGEVCLGTSNTVKVKIRLKTPNDITAATTSKNTIQLSWKKISYATYYVVYRSDTPDGEYTKLDATSETTYTDASVSAGKTYYYKIRACKKGLSAAKSVASKAIPAYTQTAKPTVTSKYSSEKVTLSWKKISGATSYYIYRLNSDEKYVKIGETTKLKYADTEVSAKKRYFYKIRGVYTSNGKTIKGICNSPHSIYTASIDPDKKMVALTFDDGPGPYTQAIINCLKKNNGRATFFVVGERIDTYSDELESAFKNGNEIANHTYSHPNLTKLNKTKIKSEISKTDKKVKTITGISTSLLRTPGGSVNSTVKSAAGKPIILWSIDTLDWKTRNKTKTINSVMNNVKDGDIILMHDIHKPTKEAALELIPKLKKKGYQLVTVSELAQYRGYKLKNGTVYNSFR